MEGQRIQEMKIISAKEYIEYVRGCDTTLHTLEKLRSKFIFDTQPYILETITNLPGRPTFLRIETQNESVKIPPFL